MILYIPTSSLNFNNIMSCESISPTAFYSQRNFGYKTFEKVELNSFDNSILLFEQFPNFQIPNSELVNYPIVIEINIDSDSEGLKKLQNGVWQIDRTVYLNPFNSKIYFFSSEHKKIILSRSESSAETKLVELYKNSIKVYKSEKNKYSLKDIFDLPNLNNQEIENDNKRNRIKGFAYAYLIAANNSTTKENIQLKNVVNKIINLSSAIVNSVSGNGTQHQNDELKALLQKVNSYQYNDVKEYLKTIIPEKHNDVWNKLYYHFGLRIPNKYNFENYFYSLTDKAKYESSLQELKNWSNKIIQSSNISKPKLEWNNIALAGNRLTQYDDTFIKKQKTKEIYQNLINDIFISTDITESSFSSERSRLADEITIKIKSYLGEEWEGSSAKRLLNSLRKNIAGQEAFNINWDTGLISAIASFLLKGDDFEKLSDFHTSTEIEDGRLAFGFYGSICGFANLSRVFTSNFYNSDSKYVISFYKKIYKQLHNIELFGDLPKEENVKTITVESKINTEETNTNIAKKTLLLIQDIEKNVPEYSKLSKVNRDFYASEINKHYEDVVDEKFIKNLKSIPVQPRTKTNWNKIISFLNKKAKETKKSKPLIKHQSSKEFQTPSLFDNLNNDLFFQDPRAFDFISSFIPKNELKRVKSEIEWIQKVHQENGYKKRDGSWVKLNNHSNEEVIKHLKNNASKQGKISSKTIDIMIKELKKKYY